VKTVIFDLDGTITKRDTYLPFLFLCLREFGLRNWTILLLPCYVLLYWAGSMPNSALKSAFLNAILSGISVRQLEAVSDRFISVLLRSNMNKESVGRLSMHLREGHRVILATASLDVYVRPLAERLGISEVVCTSAETKNGVITGRIMGANCHGIEKVRRLEERLGSAELREAVFYTDHHSDLPLLERVKQGILVKPCLRTRLILRNRKYTLMGMEGKSSIPI